MPLVKYRFDTAEARAQQLVREHVAPLVKEAGFRKTRLNWHRRRGSAVHVINIQHSQWNSHESKVSYVNVGFALDELCRWAGEAVNERILHHHCGLVGFYARLNTLLPATPSSWTIDRATDITKLAEQLCGLLRSIVAELDVVHSPRAAVTHAWFDIEWMWSDSVRQHLLELVGGG